MAKNTSIHFGKKLPEEGTEEKQVALANGILNNNKLPRNSHNNSWRADTPINFEEIMKTDDLELFTPDYIKRITPFKLSDEAAEEACNQLNQAITGLDKLTQVHYRDALVDVIDALGGKTQYNFTKYADAVKFCMFRNQGDSLILAYSKTFPERVLAAEREGKNHHFLFSYASAYTKSKLVTEVTARMLVPAHVMYHDYFHKAVGVQAEIMMDKDVSPKVRVEAANSLMTALKMPAEITKNQVAININSSGAVEELREVLGSLAQRTRTDIIEGEFTVEDAARLDIVKEDSEGTDE